MKIKSQEDYKLPFKKIEINKEQNQKEPKKIGKKIKFTDRVKQQAMSKPHFKNQENNFSTNYTIEGSKLTPKRPYGLINLS